MMTRYKDHCPLVYMRDEDGNEVELGRMTECLTEAYTAEEPHDGYVRTVEASFGTRTLKLDYRDSANEWIMQNGDL